MKNPFLKYIMKTTKDDVVHSSAYGVAQNAGGVGVASTQSFDQRMKIEKNRQSVKKYKESQIASHMYEGARAKAYVPPEKKEPKYGPRPIKMETKGIEMKGAVAVGNKTGMTGGSGMTNAGSGAIRSSSGVASGRPGTTVMKPGVTRGR